MKSAIVLTAVLLAGCTPQASEAPLLLSGNAQTQWHTMSPAERGWVGGQVITAAMGAYGNPATITILEMKAAIAPGTQLVGVCGRLKNGPDEGLFSAVYDSATLTVTGEAVYRLQDNIMHGRDVQTGRMSFSKVPEELIINDCATFGIVGE